MLNQENLDFKKENSLLNIKSSMLGLIVGDALGVPHEFNPRHVFDENPVTDMTGYGTYTQPPGTWSDDSSMALATLDGLIDILSNFAFDSNSSDSSNLSNSSNSFNIDYDIIMDNFVSWLSGAKYTPYNEVFDVGGTTRTAILCYNRGKSTTPYGLDGERDNGNGSLMRILPVALFIYYLREKHSFSLEEELSIVHNVSALTHAHKRSLIGCGIYVMIALEILKYKSQEFDDYNHSDGFDGSDISDMDLETLINNGIRFAKEYYEGDGGFSDELRHYESIFDFGVKDLDKSDIRGSGYVVNCLISSIWCLLHTDSYKDAVLMAVNLGEDTDTTAAVVGGLAGLYYGLDGIPDEWLAQIAKLDYIEDLCGKFNDVI